MTRSYNVLGLFLMCNDQKRAPRIAAAFGGSPQSLPQPLSEEASQGRAAPSVDGTKYYDPFYVPDSSDKSLCRSDESRSGVNRRATGTGELQSIRRLLTRSPLSHRQRTGREGLHEPVGDDISQCC